MAALVEDGSYGWRHRPAAAMIERSRPRPSKSETLRSFVRHRNFSCRTARWCHSPPLSGFLEDGKGLFCRDRKAADSGYR